MFWQEDITEENFKIPDTIQDAVFSIKAESLPIDHINSLTKALLQHLPWLYEVDASVHDISVADGNGWFNQYGDGALFYPSKRSKLMIRMPKNKLRLAEKILVGKILNCNNHKIEIIKAYKAKKLSDSNIIFAKFVYIAGNDDENTFLKKCYFEINKLGIKPKKMLAGLEHSISLDNNSITTRSLMLAGLRKTESVKLQEQGIGKYRVLGCGLFIQQKDIEAV